MEACHSLDLSSLNNFITIMNFKMKIIASVLGSVRRGDWIFSFDLQDAYLQIPVHRESHPYLRFCLGGRAYQFKTLCFGLSTAPQVFTRVFTLVSGGCIGGACAFSVIWTTGWWLQSCGTGFFAIRTFFSSCALIWEL